jgi:hypothetical protein
MNGIVVFGRRFREAEDEEVADQTPDNLMMCNYWRK